MAKLALNKSSLNREGQRLQTFRQFLPALDLKRKQLLVARSETRRQLEQDRAALHLLEQKVKQQLPMLADETLSPDGLVQVKQLQLGYRNLVGVELPQLQQLQLETTAYSRLLLPHWVDALVQLQTQAVELQVAIELGQARLELLEQAVQKTTQRLNLFDKVLIPRTRANIRRIRIALSDAERAGVVRAKIAKQKQRSLV